MGPEMSIAIKFLAAKIAEKEKSVYSVVVNNLRCKFVFAAARSALVCLRGSRAMYRHRSPIIDDNPADFVANVARIG